MATAGDLGLDLTPDGIAAMDRLNELEDVTIEVGYQADQKAADGETSLAEIAYWNHYGTVHKDGIFCFFQSDLQLIIKLLCIICSKLCNSFCFSCLP